MKTPTLTGNPIIAVQVGTSESSTFTDANWEGIFELCGGRSYEVRDSSDAKVDWVTVSTTDLGKTYTITATGNAA